MTQESVDYPLLEVPSSTKIHIVDNCIDCDHFLAPLLNIIPKLKPGVKLAYGLDSEWIDFNTVALVQISFSDLYHYDDSFEYGEVIVLIRLSHFELKKIDGEEVKVLPISLVNIFESDRLVATGVGVAHDICLICSQWKGCFESNQTDSIQEPGAQYIELQKVASWCAEQIGEGGEGKELRNMGLQALCVRFLNKDLSKNSQIRCGNWAADTLSPEQITYASLDSFCAILILKALKEFSSRGDVVDEYDLVGWCNHLVTPLPLTNLLMSTEINLNKNNPFKRMKRGNSNDSKNTYFVPKTRHHYDGCRMYSPKDQHLCNITARRAEWYVRNGLASLLCSAPHDEHACSIKLNFTPKGMDESIHDIFQRADRENKCVGCGQAHIATSDIDDQGRIGNKTIENLTPKETPVGTPSLPNALTLSTTSITSSTSKVDDDGSIVEGLNRFSIIPHSFRKHFPKSIKSKSSHDIVLLCHSCRDKAQIGSNSHRARLLAHHGLSNHPPPPPIDQSRRVVRSAANALFKHLKNNPSTASTTSVVNHVKVASTTKRKNGQIPPTRVAELYSIISEFHELAPNNQVSMAHIEFCCDIPLASSIPLPCMNGVTDNNSRGNTACEQHDLPKHPEELLMLKLGLIELPDETGDDSKESERTAAIQQFVEGWRRVFIESVMPEFLPEGWGIQRPVRQMTERRGN